MTFVTILIWTLAALCRGLCLERYFFMIWSYMFVKVFVISNLSHLSESIGQVTVTQTSALLAQTGQSVTVTCKVSSDADCCNNGNHFLNWYLNKPGEVMQQTAASQELHLDSVAVDLTVISLWPSVESRLKMLDIITVRVYTVEQILLVSVWVIMCSHSDKESYKNLGQSESRWLNWSCSCSEEDLKLHRHTCIWNTII